MTASLQLPRLPELRGQLIHADAAQVARIREHAARRAVSPVVALEVVHVIAARSRDAEPFGLTAVPEGADRVGQKSRAWPTPPWSSDPGSLRMLRSGPTPEADGLLCERPVLLEHMRRVENVARVP